MIRGRILVIGEQGLQSATNLLANVLIARHYFSDDYAAFSLAFASYVFLAGIQRALIIIPFVVAAHGEQAATAARSFCGANLRLTAMASLPAIASGLGLSALGHGWIGTVFMGAGLLCAGLFPYEFCRRWLLQHKRYGALVMMASIYASAVLASVSIGSHFIWPLWLIFTCMAASTAVSAIFLPEMRVGTKVPITTFAPATFRFWNVLSHLSYSGYNFAIQAIMGARISKAEMGAFYATRNLFQPVQVLVMAVDNTDKPRAAKAYTTDGFRGLFKSLARTCLTLLAIGVPYLTLIFFFHEQVLRWLYQGRFDQEAGGSIAWIGMFALMMVTQPVETGIYVIKQTRILFASRVVATALSILCCLWLTNKIGYAGAIISMAAGWAIALIGSGFGFFKAAR